MFCSRLFSAIPRCTFIFAVARHAAKALLLLSLSNFAFAVELNVKLSGNHPLRSQFTREKLREIFFARQTRWPNGKPIRAFVLPDQHPLHIRFSKEFLGVYPYQLRSAWDRMIYSGTGVPPTVVENVKEMRSKIEQTPGGIGYLEE